MDGARVHTYRNDLEMQLHTRMLHVVLHEIGSVRGAPSTVQGPARPCVMHLLTNRQKPVTAYNMKILLVYNMGHAKH